MSTGQARQTQSATKFFNKKAKNGEETDADAQNSNRKRNGTNPVFLTEQASTSTFVNSSETILLNTTQAAAARMTETPCSQVILAQNNDKEEQY